jgi:ketosteroid isomerase-like protein
VGALPFVGVYRGRRGIVQYTSELAHAYSYQHFRPKEIDGRRAIVWGWFEVTGECVPANGGAAFVRPFTFDSVIRWRLRRGRIVEHQAFFDANALIQQTR